MRRDVGSEDEPGRVIRFINKMMCGYATWMKT